MKRIASFIGVAILTFSTSVAISWVITKVTSIVFPQQSVSWPAADAILNNDLEVSFVGMRHDENGDYAQFEGMNGGSEIAYYTGYGKDSHCSTIVRQGVELKLAQWCWCGTGLERQALKPRETERFTVQIPKATEPFEVGFDFRVGPNEVKRTVWST